MPDSTEFPDSMETGSTVTVGDSKHMEEHTEPTELVSLGRAVDDSRLRSLASFDDVFKLAEESGFPVESITNYGHGFAMLDDKLQLSSLPFVIVMWNFYAGKWGEFVAAYIVTKDNRKLIITDGSTGIREQLQQVTRERLALKHTPEQAQSMLACENGLRVSDYKFDVSTREIIPRKEWDTYTGELADGATYYLA